MKRGFTLIELLAVIVILAIIALIAVPIVINIIRETKQSATLRSADFYLDAVEMSIATAKLKNKHISTGTYNIMKSGNICLKTLNNNGDCVDEEGKTNDSEYILKVEVNGEHPKEGTITIEKGKIEDISITLKDKTIVKNEEGELVYQTIPTPKSFAEDSWETIVANVKAGNLSKYKVGDTKEIALTGFTNGETNSNGLYTIRIANTSTPEECATEGHSQTACGFVIEFVDIITKHNMNLVATNVGGWKDSTMRTYVNATIYNALPKELREKIIDTTVVSGYGSGDAPNKVSIDKLYLLSTQEVWEQGTSNKIAYDTARELTRQLDYYKNLGVTTDNYSGAIKKYNGSATNWWLRSAISTNTHDFYYVYLNGVWHNNFAINTYGVVVAFRIG